MRGILRQRCRAVRLGNHFNNHAFRAMGIPACLKGGGTVGGAQCVAMHSSPSTTTFHDRQKQEASLDEIERAVL